MYIQSHTHNTNTAIRSIHLEHDSIGIQRCHILHNHKVGLSHAEVEPNLSLRFLLLHLLRRAGSQLGRQSLSEFVHREEGSIHLIKTICGWRCETRGQRGIYCRSGFNCNNLIIVNANFFKLGKILTQSCYYAVHTGILRACKNTIIKYRSDWLISAHSY